MLTVHSTKEKNIILKKIDIALNWIENSYEKSVHYTLTHRLATILSGFGIEAPNEKKDSPFKGQDDFKREEEGNKYLPYIIGGVALLGIFALYVFKSKKG